MSLDIDKELAEIKSWIDCSTFTVGSPPSLPVIAFDALERLKKIHALTIRGRSSFHGESGHCYHILSDEAKEIEQLSSGADQ